MSNKDNAPRDPKVMLEVKNLVVRYGNGVAVDGVSMTIQRGEMVALVGPNGAGKSSLVNAISGVLAPAEGVIRLGGTVAQVPEGRQMFGDLTVDDNLRLGAWRLRRRDTSRIYEVLPDLARLRRQRADTLSGGQQQMVAIGRALMAQPELLVIDELSLGLAPRIALDLAKHLKSLNQEEGTTILLIEQEIGLAFALCSRAYVMEVGHVIAEGTTAELRDNTALWRAYLGELASPIQAKKGSK